jgi:hypothetical protein
MCGDPPAGGASGSGGSSGSSGASGSGGTIIVTGGVGMGAAGTGSSDPSGGTTGVPTSGSGGEELGTTEPPGYHSCACRSLPSARRSPASAFALWALGLALLARRREVPGGGRRGRRKEVPS